jgi:NAD(P)-dependent dehydrogenase (short-subunit alcohol dehydrogenase family)
MSATVLITGANRGIGLALAVRYRQQGCRVIAVCRHRSAALVETGAKIIAGIDVACVDDIERLSDQLQTESVDILINNAGILSADEFGNINYDRVIEQFIVNAVGPLRITEALAGQLHDGAKVALITSRMGSIADNSSGGSYGYRMSKAALNAAGMSLHQDLKARKIAVGIFHPGYVQTDMVGGRGDISAAQCADRLVQRIAELKLDNSGSFWHSNGEILPW